MLDFSMFWKGKTLRSSKNQVIFPLGAFGFIKNFLTMPYECCYSGCP